jgi:hypothetical protein
MKQSIAPNLAVALALLAWPLSYYGFTLLGADYARGTPTEYIYSAQHRATLIFAAGLLCLFGGLWFSGRSLALAKARSLSALCICLAFFVVAVCVMWM